MAHQLLHTSTPPLPLDIGTILPFLQSFDILFVLRMLLKAPSMRSGLYANMVRAASIGSSSGSEAFPFPIFAICFFTSSSVNHSTGPSVFGNLSSCCLGFSALKSLSTFCFHLPLIFSRFPHILSFSLYAPFPLVCPNFSLAVDTKISCILFQSRSSPISYSLVVTDACYSILASSFFNFHHLICLLIFLVCFFLGVFIV